MFHASSYHIPASASHRCLRYVAPVFSNDANDRRPMSWWRMEAAPRGAFTTTEPLSITGCGTVQDNVHFCGQSWNQKNKQAGCLGPALIYMLYTILYYLTGCYEILFFSRYIHICRVFFFARLLLVFRLNVTKCKR